MLKVRDELFDTDELRTFGVTPLLTHVESLSPPLTSEETAELSRILRSLGVAWPLTLQ
jgi:hypothetical protein